MALAAHIALAPERPWKRGIAWLAFLGPFFLATYGAANWAASRREFVDSIVFDWEWDIPFVAWSIVPYWSIDLFYVLSLLVCASVAELDTHAKRLLCAQVISVVCFLIFPLSFSFVKPWADGVPGVLFNLLAGFDRPFNQAPSLHVSLLVILWVFFARRVTGAWQWLLHGWFAVVAVSTLTTYQHHFIDLPTGAWTGWLCVWLFPETGDSLLARVQLTGSRQRRDLALRYSVAAVTVAVVALALGGWGLWLLWAAGSLGLVAVIYGFLDECAFQKKPDGGMSLAARVLLAPYIAGAWLNSRWWTRNSRRPNGVVPGLLIGRLATRAEREASGVRAVVDLTAELPCDASGARYTNAAQLDLVSPSVAQIRRSVRAIERAMVSGPVLVCCALGFSRSALAVAAWLIATKRTADCRQAVEMIRRARPEVVIDDVNERVLEEFSREGSRA